MDKATDKRHISLKRFSDCSGQTFVEYAFILVLIAVVVVAVVTYIGLKLDNSYRNSYSSLP